MPITYGTFRSTRAVASPMIMAYLKPRSASTNFTRTEISEQMPITRDEDKSTDQIILEILESLMRGGCWCLLTKASSHSPDCERARAAVERLRRKCAGERAEQPSAHEHQWVDVTEYQHVERHFRCRVPFCGASKTEPIE